MLSVSFDNWARYLLDAGWPIERAREWHWEMARLDPGYWDDASQDILGHTQQRLGRSRYGEMTLRYTARLFREIGTLAAHLSDDELAARLHVFTNHIVTPDLYHLEAPPFIAEAVWLSMYFVFRDVFAPRCGNTLFTRPTNDSPSDPERATSLPEVCHWWFGFDTWYRPRPPFSRLGHQWESTIERLKLALAFRIYGLPSAACRQSAMVAESLMGCDAEPVVYHETRAFCRRLLDRYPEAAGQDPELAERAGYHDEEWDGEGPEAPATMVGSIDLMTTIFERAELLLPATWPAIRHADPHLSSPEMARSFEHLIDRGAFDGFDTSEVGSAPRLLSVLMSEYGEWMSHPRWVPWPTRERCWRSMVELFGKYFGPHCGDLLPGDHGCQEVHELCVYWWWLVPTAAFVEEPEAAAQLDVVQLDVLRELLAIRWQSCQASGLRGLLQRAMFGQSGVSETLEWFLGGTNLVSSRMRHHAIQLQEYVSELDAR